MNLPPGFTPRNPGAPSRPSSERRLPPGGARGGGLAAFRRHVTFERAAIVVLAVLVLALIWPVGGEHEPAPSPARLEKIGREYGLSLPKIHGRALIKGAERLEADQPFIKTLDEIAQAWESGRIVSFEALISPSLDALIKQGTDEKAISREQKRAYAAALREIAKGEGADR